MSKEKVFANGFVFKRQDNAPEWVIGGLSCKVDEAIAFMKNHVKADGWVNLSIKISQSEKYYIELDTWEPKKQEAPKVEKTEEADPIEDEDPADLPF